MENLNTIPTAKELFFSIVGANPDEFNISIEDCMIAFAKLHREAILKSVIENVELETYGNFGNSINKDSILNAYPVTLIK